MSAVSLNKYLPAVSADTTIEAAPALTAAAAAGSTPTKAEFDKLLDDVTAIRTSLNGVVSALS